VSGIARFFVRARIYRVEGLDDACARGGRRREAVRHHHNTLDIDCICDCARNLRGEEARWWSGWPRIVVYEINRPKLPHMSGDSDAAQSENLTCCEFYEAYKAEIIRTDDCLKELLRAKLRQNYPPPRFDQSEIRRSGAGLAELWNGASMRWEQIANNIGRQEMRRELQADQVERPPPTLRARAERKHVPRPTCYNGMGQDRPREPSRPTKGT